MSDAVATVPTSGHVLLLGLAGWVDDDLLACGRELVAVGEDALALELLVASLSAARTVLPVQVRAVLLDAAERRLGPDVAGTLPSGVPMVAETAHRFAAGAGPERTETRIAELADGLPVVARSGARLALTWRLTPAGAAPGPLPHPVLLAELDEPGSAEVLAYQLGTALSRAGVPASVEAFADGEPLPPYQVAARAAARPLGPTRSRPATRVADAAPAPFVPAPVLPAAVAPDPVPPETVLPETVLPETVVPERVGPGTVRTEPDDDGGPDGPDHATTVAWDETVEDATVADDDLVDGGSPAWGPPEPAGPDGDGDTFHRPAPEPAVADHPSPRPAPRRPGLPVPAAAPPDPAVAPLPGTMAETSSPPVDRMPDVDAPEPTWAQDWRDGSWSTPTDRAEADPDIEPATSPTPSTPRPVVPGADRAGPGRPSPVRRASDRGDDAPVGDDEEPDTADPSGPWDGQGPRHRLDAPVPNGSTGPAGDPSPSRTGPDGRLTANEQELLRRLQEELAARESGSTDQPTPPRNGTHYPPDQDRAEPG